MGKTQWTHGVSSSDGCGVIDMWLGGWSASGGPDSRPESVDFMKPNRDPPGECKGFMKYLQQRKP